MHHLERVADQPRKSVDPKNMVAVNNGPHQTIHQAEAHTPEAVNQLAEQLGWPGRVPPSGTSTPSNPSADQVAPIEDRLAKLMNQLLLYSLNFRSGFCDASVAIHVTVMMGKRV